MTVDIQATAVRLADARQATLPAAPISAEAPFSLEEAYAIQDALRAEMIRRDRAPVGWKLAATGPVGQALFGVEEPICGFLMPEVHASGDQVSAAGFVGMHVEAEFCFKLGADLAGPGVTAERAAAAVASVMPALELPDMLFSTGMHVTDAIANAALGKAIVLGPETAYHGALDLAAEQATFIHNDQTIGTNSGVELLGGPLNALAWLANKLNERGLSLKAGDLVMSGALSQLLKAAPGDSFTVNYSTLGSVEMNVV